MKKKLLIIGGIGIVLLLISGALAGIALADDPPAGKNGIQQTFISKFARILGIQEQQVKDAAKKAQLEMVDDAVKAGKLTEEQGNRAKERIEKSGGYLGVPRIQVPRLLPRGTAPLLRIGNLANEIKGLADFLGMKPNEIVSELKSGKTLAQIGSEHGKTAEQLKDAIMSRIQKGLDEAVAKGRLTQEKAEQMKSQASERIDNLLNKSFKGGNPAPKS